MARLREHRQLKLVCAPRSLPNKFLFSLREPVFLSEACRIIASLITEQPGAPVTISILLTRHHNSLQMYFQFHRGCRTAFSLCQQDYGLSVTESCPCQHPFVISMNTVDLDVNTELLQAF